MSFARKIRRKGLNKTSCCGSQMVTKSGYSDDTYELYICMKCGKEKWVERGK